MAALGRLGEHVGAVAVITGRPARTVVRLGRFREVAGLESMIEKCFILMMGQYGENPGTRGEGRTWSPPIPQKSGGGGRKWRKFLIHLAWPEPESRTKVGPLLSTRARCRIRGRRSPSLRTPLGDLADRYGLVLGPGKNVWEIRAPGMDKGAALRAIVDETGARHLIFAGDDLGDLPAFQAVRELVTSGVAGLLVCSASTEEDALTELSDVIVDGPSGLAAWLNELAERLGG